ncbi:hypothetical protein ACWGIN_27750 [Streptomyces sp. NPDC054861]
MNFEHPTCRTEDGFDIFDLTVDLVVAPGLTRWQWKDEYAHVRRLGIVSDAEHRAADAARGEVLAMLTGRSGVFGQAERWASWRWEPAWPTPCLPRPVAAAQGLHRKGAAQLTGGLLAAGDRRCDREWEPAKTDSVCCSWSALLGKPVRAGDTSFPRSSRGVEVFFRSGLAARARRPKSSGFYIPARSIPRPRLQPVYVTASPKGRSRMPRCPVRPAPGIFSTNCRSRRPR